MPCPLKSFSRIVLLCQGFAKLYNLFLDTLKPLWDRMTFSQKAYVKILFAGISTSVTNRQWREHWSRTQSCTNAFDANRELNPCNWQHVLMIPLIKHSVHHDNSKLQMVFSRWGWKIRFFAGWNRSTIQVFLCTYIPVEETSFIGTEPV